MVLGQPSHLHRGWYWGSQEFAEKLRRISEKVIGARTRSSQAYRKTPQVKAHGNDQAESWLIEGLAAAGMAPEDLPGIKGSDRRKLALAELIWKRTTDSQVWIAGRLSMGSAAIVSQQLRRMSTRKAKVELPPKLQQFLAEALQSA